MPTPAPLCFVLMPFGKKIDAAGLTIDFDAVYQEVIKPAIADAGLEPLRADEEMTGGIIHKPMYERLILCPFAVADLTTANANVFYELGVRHAVRPAATVLLFAEGGRLPFDVAPLRAMPYRLTAEGKPADPSLTRGSLATRLREARQAANQQERSLVDSPIYQLVDSFPDVQHMKTDVFRERVEYARDQKEKLAEVRKQGLPAVEAFERSLGESLDGLESGVLIDLFLSYRAVKGWQQMIDLVGRMPRPLATTVLVQEQLALALNRAGRDEQAEAVLQGLLASRGPSSETYGILGRIYKDRYDRAQKKGSTHQYQTRGYLEQAIEVYLKGFEADWRDAYPGINAVTLMELRDPPDPRQKDLLPLVTYAVKRRIAAGKPDYWDYATLLELAVLARDEEQAKESLGRALVFVREAWEPETTARNINLILEARKSRGESSPDWLATVLAQLLSAPQELPISR
jgi:tetratricopeptide (TPR) repeat protein